MELKNLTFRGGISVHHNKEMSNGVEIQVMPSPDEVMILMGQHVGAKAVPLVKKGDLVRVGEKIAEAQGPVSVPMHASVSGEVTGIQDFRDSMGQNTLGIVIKNDHQDTLGYEPVNRRNENLDAEQIITYIREAGIVGLGGAGFPTAVKVKTDGKCDTVILNGSECESYVTSDELMMRTTPERVVDGLHLLLIATGAKQGFIAIEDNKPLAIEAIQKALTGRENMQLAVVKTKYPQGDEKRVIQAVTGRKVPRGKLPLAVGCVVSNVSTAAAIADAVYDGKPLYERVVTVTGHAVNHPMNVLTRIGTRTKDLVEFTGGYASTPGKIINGGAMMGRAIYDDSQPTEKRNNAVLVMTQEESKPVDIKPCIRCGRCLEVCPVYLEPVMIANHARVQDWDTVREFYPDQCIECGSCQYTCPAGRPLLEMIRFSKRELKRIDATK